MLTGKYKGQQPGDGSRLSFRIQVDGSRYWHEKGFRIAELLEATAREAGVPMHTLALAWPLRHRFVSSVVVGVKTPEQMVANMETGDWDLGEDLWRQLEESTKPPEEYLTWFNRQNYNRIINAGEIHDERIALL